jgi:uncharacterized protein (DUF427 family)
VVVAKSSQNVFLFETMLRPRYYLSSTNVDWGFLTESETTSYCPYKGMSKYVLSVTLFFPRVGVLWMWRGK